MTGTIITSLIMEFISIVIMVVSALNAIECYAKRQLVKANFYLSVSTFSLMVIFMILFMLDGCSAGVNEFE